MLGHSIFCIILNQFVYNKNILKYWFFFLEQMKCLMSYVVKF